MTTSPSINPTHRKGEVEPAALSLVRERTPWSDSVLIAALVGASAAEREELIHELAREDRHVR